MHRPITLILAGMALAACTATEAPRPPTAPPPAMANPASVYCRQQGHRVALHTAADGGQTGQCVFREGGACDEWAYYRGECGPAPQANPTPAPASGGDLPPEAAEAITDWWGVIRRAPPGAQYDDYFERRDLGQALYFGLDSLDPALQAQIVAERDSGRIVHLYGILLSNTPDYNGSQIQVTGITVED